MSWRLFLALAAGVLLAFSNPLSLPPLQLPAPLGLWHFYVGSIDLCTSFVQFSWLAFIALVPLFIAIRGAARPAHAFLYGYLCGLAWLLPGWVWLGSFGPAAVVGLAVYFALPIGFFAYLAWWLINSPQAAASPARFVWGLPLTWTALEYLRSFGFWAYPWNLLGYSQARTPLFIQTADLGGVFLVSFLIVLCNSLIAVLLIRPPKAMLELRLPLQAWRWRARFSHAGGAALVLLLALSYGAWRLELLRLPRLRLPGLSARAEAATPKDLSFSHGAAGKGTTRSAGGSRAHPGGHPANSHTPVVSFERPLDVILVQGGLNTNESWNSPGVLAKTLQAYVPRSDEAISDWKTLHHLNSPVNFNSFGLQQPGGLRFSRQAAGHDETEITPPWAGQRLPAPPGTVPAGGASLSSGMAKPGASKPGQPKPGTKPKLDGSAAKPAGPATPRALPGNSVATQQQPSASAVVHPLAQGYDSIRDGVRTAMQAAGETPKPDERDLLLIWPEGALPKVLDPSNSYDLPGEVRMLTRRTPNMALLMGTLGYPNQPGRMENGCMLYTGQGLAQWPYSKVRLVPFGEVVPFRHLISILKYPWGSEDLSEGRRLTPLSWNGHRLGLMICFDNVFGFLTRQEALKGAQYFVIMTNNSWYKLAAGVRQHCDLDFLRAVENRRPLVRCSTTGASHVIDKDGRLRQETQAASSGLITAELSKGTATTLYMRVGDLFSQLSLLAALLLCALPIIFRRGEGWL